MNEECAGWSHPTTDSPEPVLCSYHQRVTARLDSHRAAQIAAQCPDCKTPPRKGQRR